MKACTAWENEPHGSSTAIPRRYRVLRRCLGWVIVPLSSILSRRGLLISSRASVCESNCVEVTVIESRQCCCAQTTQARNDSHVIRVGTVLADQFAVWHSRLRDRARRGKAPRTQSMSDTYAELRHMGPM